MKEPHASVALSHFMHRILRILSLNDRDSYGKVFVSRDLGRTKMTYADVIVDISHEKLDRSFQYEVPDGLAQQVKPGTCVMIPFGKGDRKIKGYVVGIGKEPKIDPALIKQISGIAQRGADGEDRSIELAAWMKENYGSTMIQALKTVLPMRKSVKKLERRTIEGAPFAGAS